LFGIERTSVDNTEQLVCISNLTAHPRQLDAQQLDAAAGEHEWHDLIEGQSHAFGAGNSVLLQPWQTLWLSSTR
jgi:hypothetical protein